MKQGLQLRIGQNLTMTPQLQQAIKLLQLSALELNTEIQQTLESNPLLEQDDNLSETVIAPSSGTPGEDDGESVIRESSIANSLENRAETRLPEDFGIDTGWDEYYEPIASMTSQSSGSREDHRDLFENQSVATNLLSDHLLWQLNGAHLSAIDYDIGLAIIDSTDDSGYLTQSIEDIYTGLKVQYEALELDEVEAVRHLIQRFDPVGVAASSPRECMLVQLGQYAADTPHLEKAIAMVEHYLEQLAAKDYPLLKRRLQASDAELGEVIKLIQTTNPHPGHLVSENQAQYIAPDVYVKKHSGRWNVSINAENAPRLRVNDLYAGLIKRRDNSKQNAYLKDHLQEARWFIKSLQSRNETLLRAARAIVERQHAFLDYGEEAMQPLVLRDIAEILEMHESTISRVTTNKYMHTPRGIFEFKYFFSSHVNTAAGGECSAIAIRALIKKLIAAEPAQKPLSDSKIALLLGEQGISVARRTVAKYREAMQITPSHARKRLF